MSAFNTLLAAALVVVNLVAVGAAITARAESATRLRAWARASAAAALGLIVLPVIRCIVIAVGSTSLEPEPSNRAALLGQSISEGINGVAMAILGAMLPLLVALAFGLRASRKASAEP